MISVSFKEAHERQMLKESSLSWEKLQATIDSCMADAEDTKAFWDSCPNKLAVSMESVKSIFRLISNRKFLFEVLWSVHYLCC